MPDQTTTQPAGARYWVRIADAILAEAIAWPGWTVTDTIPDTRGVTLVEVLDASAPAAAAGRLCQPQFTRTVGRECENDPPKPAVVRITDYGIVDDSCVCPICRTVQQATASAKIGHHSAPPWPDEWPHRTCSNCCPGAGLRAGLR